MPAGCEIATSISGQSGSSVASEVSPSGDAVVICINGWARNRLGTFKLRHNTARELVSGRFAKRVICLPSAPACRASVLNCDDRVCGVIAFGSGSPARISTPEQIYLRPAVAGRGASRLYMSPLRRRGSTRTPHCWQRLYVELCHSCWLRPSNEPRSIVAARQQLQTRQFRDRLGDKLYVYTSAIQRKTCVRAKTVKADRALQTSALLIELNHMKSDGS